MMRRVLLSPLPALSFPLSSPLFPFWESTPEESDGDDTPLQTSRKRAETAGITAGITGNNTGERGALCATFSPLLSSSLLPWAQGRPFSSFLLFPLFQVTPVIPERFSLFFTPFVRKAVQEPGEAPLLYVTELTTLTLTQASRPLLRLVTQP